MAMGGDREGKGLKKPLEPRLIPDTFFFFCYSMSSISKVQVKKRRKKIGLIEWYGRQPRWLVEGK